MSACICIPPIATHTPHMWQNKLSLLLCALHTPHNGIDLLLLLLSFKCTHRQCVHQIVDAKSKLRFLFEYLWLLIVENFARFHLGSMRTELSTLPNQSIPPDDFHCLSLDTIYRFPPFDQFIRSPLAQRFLTQFVQIRVSFTYIEREEETVPKKCDALSEVVETMLSHTVSCAVVYFIWSTELWPDSNFFFSPFSSSRKHFSSKFLFSDAIFCIPSWFTHASKSTKHEVQSRKEINQKSNFRRHAFGRKPRTATRTRKQQKFTT